MPLDHDEDHNPADDLYDRSIAALRDVLDAADTDAKTGEIILWGRWATDRRIIEERFDNLEDVAYFLEHFGWSIESQGGSRFQTSHVHFKPFGKRTVLKRKDVLDLLKGYDLFAGLESDEQEDRLYSIRKSTEPSKLEAVRVELATANTELLDFLQQHPNLLHTVSPRQLEEVVGGIFENMGYEVELTPQTRDGGYDIRALRKDGVGTLLYLIECKRYSPRNPVGVELVRTLYGTVTEARASHGVLATTSYFSPDAREFADRLRYQLSLRDYRDLTRWLAELPPRTR